MTAVNEGLVLVTGASGVLGWHLCRYLSQQGHQVAGTYCRHRPGLPGVEVHQLDLEIGGKGLEMARSLPSRAVVHSAALCNPDRCEKDPARTDRINVEGTRELLEGLRERVPLIYISTDLVFDGLRGDYRESDPVDPPNAYARSKQTAERLVLERENSVVVRMAKVYTAGSPFSNCFVDWMRQRFAEGGPVPLYHDQYRSPVWVGDVARAVELLFQTERRHRLYHLGGPERMNRVRFGELYAQSHGLDQGLIESVSSDVAGQATRGKDCSLNSSRFVEEFSFRLTRVEEGLVRMREGRY